jgi:V8-like Glu-specific endopeptidase
MLKKLIQTNIEKATVRITKLGGQGVLVGGNMILTAAHCFDYSLTGGMVLGDYYIEEIKIKRGKILKVAPLAIEPLTDIAALGSVDVQEFGEESINFEEFCEKTKPVHLCLKEFELFQTFTVYINSHESKWISGTATLTYKDAPMLSLETEEVIKSGTSGSPIVNEMGELVGIISHISSDLAPIKHNGTAPRPHLALPVWLVHNILRSETE